jgi:hypothetical protein
VGETGTGRCIQVATRSVTRRLLASVLLLSTGAAHAASLSDQLGIFQPGEVTITPSILRLQQALARATDFPATTTTPGFTYRYDPASGAYERVSGTLGPAFLERAETIGAGRVDLSVSYLYARFTRINGETLSESLSSKFLVKSGALIVPQRIQTRDFSLTSNVVYFSATYGVDERTDVNLLVPVYSTSMRGDRRFSFFGQPGVAFESLDGDAFGPGDVLLRGKRRFLEGDAWDLAAGLTLHLPSGSVANFQGIGDVVVTPSIVGSWIGPAYEVHGSVGIDIDADDLQRSGVRYGVGVEWAPLERLTLLTELVGTSGFATDDLSFFVADRRLVSIRGEFDPPLVARAVGNGTEFTTTINRTDIVDLAIGLKVNVFGNLICFASAIVPLTQDGARANVIPVGGIQYGF